MSKIEIEIEYSYAELLRASKVLKTNCKKQHNKGGCKRCLFYDNDNTCLISSVPFCWPCKSGNGLLEIEKKKNGQLRKKLHEKKQECQSLKLKLSKIKEVKE